MVYNFGKCSVRVITFYRSPINDYKVHFKPIGEEFYLSGIVLNFAAIKQQLMAISVEKIQEFQGHKDCIYAISYGETAKEFFTGAGDGWVVRWNLESGNEGKLAATFPTSIYAIRYLAGRDVVMVGLSRGGYFLLDLESAQPFKSFQKDHGIFDFKIIPDQQNMIIAGEKGNLHFLDLDNYEEVKSEKPASGNVRNINLSPDGNYFVAGFSDEYIRIYDTANFELVKEFWGHEKSAFCATYSPDGKYLLSGGRDAQLKIWDVENDYDLYLKVPAHYFTINDIVVSPDHRWFATGSRDKTLKIWDLETFELQKVIDMDKFEGHRHSINEMIWTTYNNYLVSASDDKLVKVWKITQD